MQHAELLMMKDVVQLSEKRLFFYFTTSPVFHIFRILEKVKKIKKIYFILLQNQI